jgi:probable HAF family extracellular repeat protein
LASFKREKAKPKGGNMTKFRILTCITATTLFAAVAVPGRLAAQEHQQNKQQARYKLVDLGTLGGPNSYTSVNGGGIPILNDAGIVSSSADTFMPDSNAPNLCFNPDCFLTHAFRWQDGILTDLGALPGLTSSAAGAINELGWSVGQSQNGVIDPLLGIPETRAVLWTRRGIINLGTLGGNQSLAVYVNNGGQVVGLATNAIPDPYSVFGWGAQIRTFLWENGVMRDLGTLGGPDATPSANCANQRNGLIAGASYINFTPNPTTGVPTIDPFLWKNGEMLDLGTLGGTNGFAQCTNNRAQVTGQSNLSGDLTFHPFLWDDGVLTDLGTLGGDNGTPGWINDAGEVVGQADLPGSQVHHAFLWRRGVMTDLGTLGSTSIAEAINSKSQVVGRSRLGSPTSILQHAFLWQEGGPMVDLNTLIPANSSLQLTDAININERGEILGQGLPPGVQPGDNVGHLVLLIPCGDDAQGCEDTAHGTNASDPTSANNRTTSTQPSLANGDTVAGWRARLAQRYHVSGLGASERDWLLPVNDK